MRFVSKCVPIRLPYSQQIQANANLNIDSMNAMNVDPTQYMAPMDLYESIWGGMSPFTHLSSVIFSWQLETNSPPESPDPWNTGMDSLNFDFLAHPPPGQPQQQFYF
jgi:hypothetical protein